MIGQKENRVGGVIQEEEMEGQRKKEERKENSPVKENTNLDICGGKK